MELQPVTSSVLVMIVGGVFSIIFTWFPKLREGFAGLESTKKSLITLGVLVIASLAIFGLGCWDVLDQWGIQLECSRNGALQLITVFVLTLAGNQITYLITPKPESVRQAKALRTK